MAENENVMTEAPAVVWTTVYHEDEKGGKAKVNITVRAANTKKAFDELMETVSYAEANYGFSMYETRSTFYSSESKAVNDVKKAQDRDENQTQSSAQNNVKFQVTALCSAQTSKGTPQLKVKGGEWKKFGQTAWAEVVPESAADFANWELGEDVTDIPDDMTYAIFDPNKKKIVGFSET